MIADERLVRLGAGQHSAVDIDRRRGADAEPRAHRHAVAHPLGELRRIQTAVESRRVEATVRRVLLERIDLERLLIREQLIVILPELALLAGAVRRLARLERLRVDLRQRKVLPDDAHLVAVRLPHAASASARTRWQNGHWKSENSTIVTGAEALPSEGSVAAISTDCRGASSITRTDGAGLPQLGDERLPRRRPILLLQDID